MKLSTKYFCIAYIIVLLSTGAGGMALVSSVTSALWDTQAQKVKTAENYAAASFLSLAEMAPENLDRAKRNNIVNQIERNADSSVSRIRILSESEMGEEYQSLKDGEGFTRFFEQAGRMTMEASCKLEIGGEGYVVSAYSDFTGIEDRVRVLWQIYGGAVLLLAAVSGAALYLASARITRPLNRLADAADRISAGGYGEIVIAEGKEAELVRLSDSFNRMSGTIERKINEIQEEMDRRDRFVANFTHEMKMPMTAIIGYAQMLNTYDLEEEERRQAAEGIYREGRRLENLSQQLLELYVYQNDEAEMERVVLPELAEPLSRTLELLSEKYGVEVEISFENVAVKGNQILLLSLLYNLADNGMKASCPAVGESNEAPEPQKDGERCKFKGTLELGKDCSGCESKEAPEPQKGGERCKLRGTLESAKDCGGCESKEAPEPQKDGERCELRETLELGKDCGVSGKKDVPAYGKVLIQGRTAGDKVRISVRDWGRGIQPDSIKHLTEPFFREDKARSRELGGAGLGLSLCQRIAQLHGSGLTFDSKVGEGTTVSFELELAPYEEEIKKEEEHE